MHQNHESLSNARQRKWLLVVASVATSGALVALPAMSARAAMAPISGATAWGPCEWYTSNNLRYTSVANKTVRAQLTTTGKLGVKMRSLNVNTGQTATIAYFPPLDTWKPIGTYRARNAPFRLQFTCVNTRDPRERPSTNFAGSLDY